MVAEATSTAGITNFVHVSALNANPDSPSSFLRSKVASYVCRITHIQFFQFEGEEAVRAICPSTVIVRPANMMGDEDRYLNYFACKYRNVRPILYHFAFTDLVRVTRFAPVLKQSFQAYKEPIYVQPKILLR